MESYIQLTPLNNYLSNCVIKLHMKLLTPNLPLSNCVIKLHTKLQTHLDIFLESHGDVVCYSGVVVLNSWKFNCVEVENWKT
jgi:hypothetical protein